MSGHTDARAHLLARRDRHRRPRRRRVSRADGRADRERGHARPAALPRWSWIAVAFALPSVTSDGRSSHVRWHDGLVFGAVLLAGAVAAMALERLPRPRVTPALRRGSLVLGVAAVVAVVAFVASKGTGSGAVGNSGGEDRLHELELPLRLVAAGVATASSTTWSPAPAQARSTYEPALPHDLPRLRDRAARPAGAVPDRGRIVGLALFLLAAAALCGRPAPPRPRARARARSCRPTSSIRSSTSTGTSSPSRRPRSSSRARSSAARRCGRVSPFALLARGRCRAARVRRAPPAVARRALVDAGDVCASAAAGGDARQAGALRRPAPRRPAGRSARVRIARGNRSSRVAYYAEAVERAAEEPETWLLGRPFALDHGCPRHAYTYLEPYTELNQKARRARAATTTGAALRARQHRQAALLS